jgi:hypothetical protein
MTDELPRVVLGAEMVLRHRCYAGAASLLSGRLVDPAPEPA